MALYSGYNPQLVAILNECVVRKESILSVSLYFRNFVAQTFFDRDKDQWVKRLTEDGEAGVILRVGGVQVVVAEVSEKHGPLYVEENVSGSLRFNVEPFQVGRIVHGPIDPDVVLEYLYRVKHRLYSEDSAIKPRDFAVDMIEWINLQGKFRNTDLTVQLVRSYHKEDFPPKTRAPESF
jgi:hypothetical protein